MMKKFALSLLAILTVVGVSAAQTWYPFPIIGGASFCSSQVNAACVNTVPAGPALTGLETMPIDTNAARGVSPQTAKIGVASLGAGLVTYSVPVSGNTITLTSVTRQLIVLPAGTIAALTIVTPAASTLVEGQRLGICGNQIVTTLTMTAGSGTTLDTAPTAMLVPVLTGAASCFEFIYRQSNTTWYRVQ